MGISVDILRADSLPDCTKLPLAEHLGEQSCQGKVLHETSGFIDRDRCLVGQSVTSPCTVFILMFFIKVLGKVPVVTK